MKVNIYTIYDKVACEAGPVFQAKNDLVAVRMLKSLVSDNPNISIDEYEVYCLGEFDTEKRSFVPEDGYGRLAISNILEVNE